jgi:hypothetical protein
MNRQLIAHQAAISGYGTSLPIRVGIKVGAAKEPSPVTNRLSANKSRKQRVDRRDEALRPHVTAWIAAIGAAARKSPTALAKHLNALGHLTARGNAYSLNTTKDLLRRLELSSSITPEAPEKLSSPKRTSIS